MFGERQTARLAIFSTHPIQYQVPWFRALAAEPRLDVQIYYALIPGAIQQGIGFGVEFEWDLPLLDRYPWRLLKNSAARPSLDGFRGCDVRNVLPLLRKERSDIALISGWNSLYLLQALWACKRLGIPTLVRGDSNILAPRGWLKSQVQRFLIQQFSAFLAVGELNRRLYEQAGVQPERIFFCPHFIDNERFSNQADKLRPQREQMRGNWDIPRDAICFLFAGKLVAKKRLMDFLQAVTRAAQLNPLVYGLVVGAGEQLDEARAFAAAHQPPIRFAGFLNQSKMAAAYVVSDALVLPSDSGETWGLVVNEAMACGLPAIVSDQVGCGPDLVTDGQTGAVFPMGNVAMLAEAIIEMAKSRHRLSVLGQAAHQRVITRYSLSQAVDGLMSAAAWVSQCEARRATRD